MTCADPQQYFSSILSARIGVQILLPFSLVVSRLIGSRSLLRACEPSVSGPLAEIFDPSCQEHQRCQALAAQRASMLVCENKEFSACVLSQGSGFIPVHFLEVSPLCSFQGGPGS